MTTTSTMVIYILAVRFLNASGKNLIVDKKWINFIV
jgi:hypothetical protein